MFDKIVGRLRATVAASRAGWIASSCKTGCVVDNETEEIRACFIHNAEIARLSKISLDNWPEKKK